MPVRDPAEFQPRQESSVSVWTVIALVAIAALALVGCSSAGATDAGTAPDSGSRWYRLR